MNSLGANMKLIVECSQKLVRLGENLWAKEQKLDKAEPLDVPTMTTDFVKEHGLPCPEGYIFKDENGNVINTHKIVMEKKEKEYPKTYEECVEILGQSADVTYGYKKYVLHRLQMLLVCRDAYRKVYGEENGLEKPWEPDWTTDDVKHSLVNIGNTIILSVECKVGRILAFPTKEMRDAFYDNFKEEIEFCKELL